MTETVMLWQWMDALPLFLGYFSISFLSCVILLGVFKNSKVLNTLIWQESLWTQIKAMLPALIIIPLILSLNFARYDLFEQEEFSGVEFNDEKRTIYLLEPSNGKRYLGEYEDIVSFSVLRNSSFGGIRLLVITKSLSQPVAYSAAIQNRALSQIVKPIEKRGFLYFD